MPTPDDLLTVQDIVILQTDSTKIRQRCINTCIHSPNGGNPSVRHEQEQVVEVNGRQEASRTYPAIDLDFMTQVATVLFELTDPVTNEVHKVSGAYVAQWIRAHYVKRVQNPLPHPNR
jgi:hypothetical protein